MIEEQLAGKSTSADITARQMNGSIGNPRMTVTEFNETPTSEGSPLCPILSRVNISLADDPLSVEINARIDRAVRRGAAAQVPWRMSLSARVLASDAVRPVVQAIAVGASAIDLRSRTLSSRAYTRERLIAAGFVFAPPEALEFAVDLNGEFKGHS